MNTMIELDTFAASRIYGGKDEQTARLVEFIAECIGSIVKMIYLANKLRKIISTPAAL